MLPRIADAQFDEIARRHSVGVVSRERDDRRWHEFRVRLVARNAVTESENLMSAPRALAKQFEMGRQNHCILMKKKQLEIVRQAAQQWMRAPGLAHVDRPPADLRMGVRCELAAHRLRDQL
jgi:hypothetical protein